MLCQRFLKNYGEAISILRTIQGVRSILLEGTLIKNILFVHNTWLLNTMVYHYTLRTDESNTIVQDGGWHCTREKVLHTHAKGTCWRFRIICKYYMSKTSWPILYIELLCQIGQNFLDIQLLDVRPFVISGIRSNFASGITWYLVSGKAQAWTLDDSVIGQNLVKAQKC